MEPKSFSLPSEVCSVDCGTHGVCMGGACRCEEGWTGAGCDQRVCNPLCIKHGTCKDGKCQCHQGWNGEHCTIGKHLCVYIVCGGVCLTCVCVSTHGCVKKHPVRLKLAAPFHFVRGIWKWEVEAKGRLWGIRGWRRRWVNREMRSKLLRGGGGMITKEHHLAVFGLPFNCRPQEC